MNSLYKVCLNHFSMGWWENLSWDVAKFVYAKRPRQISMSVWPLLRLLTLLLLYYLYLVFKSCTFIGDNNCWYYWQMFPILLQNMQICTVLLFLLWLVVNLQLILQILLVQYEGRLRMRRKVCVQKNDIPLQMVEWNNYMHTCMFVYEFSFFFINVTK